MAKKRDAPATPPVPPAARPSALLDTRVIYCGDNLLGSRRGDLDQLRSPCRVAKGNGDKLPEACIDLIYIDPPYILVRPDRIIP